MSGLSLTVSVVSHGQIELVDQLLADLAKHCAADLSVVLTHNIAEREVVLPADWAHRLEVVQNERPAGFGANHNAAFRRCITPLFCVVNPDIRLARDPFPALVATLESGRIAAAGPMVLSPSGKAEDSARRFPTVARLLWKLAKPPRGPEYPVDRGPIAVDWVAGMFMLFRAEAFRFVSGFDERFFLYYEDVDICRRLRGAGYSITYDPNVSVVHDARRASRRNPRLMAIHAASALRYLLGRYV